MVVVVMEVGMVVLVVMVMAVARCSRELQSLCLPLQQPAVFVANLRTFECKISRLEMCSCKKMTNIRYVTVYAMSTVSIV